MWTPAPEKTTTDDEAAELAAMIQESIDAVDVDALTEFTSLTTVNDGFYLYYNQDLGDVSGLSALEYIGGDFNVAYNSSLSDSDAEALAESIGYIGGSTNIYGNSGR